MSKVIHSFLSFHSFYDLIISQIRYYETSKICQKNLKLILFGSFEQMDFSSQNHF